MDIIWSDNKQAWYIYNWHHELIAAAASKFEVFEWLTEHGYTNIDTNWAKAEDCLPLWHEG